MKEDSENKNYVSKKTIYKILKVDAAGEIKDFINQENLKDSVTLAKEQKKLNVEFSYIVMECTYISKTIKTIR